MLRQMTTRTFTDWRAFHRAESILREKAIAEAKQKAGVS